MFKFFKNNRNKEISTKEDYDIYLKKVTKRDIPYGFNNNYANQEDKLYQIFGDCSNFNSSLKLIVISDTHNDLIFDDFQEFINKHNNYDICILLGDHSSSDIEKILKCVDKTKLYGILGNHYRNYLKEYDINSLNGQIININGVSLLGIEGSYKYKEEGYPSFTQKESIDFLNDKPKVDILVSHDNRFDSSKIYDVAHQGLFGITYYLYKNKIPYHIHGHIHNSYKNIMINGTKEISVYMYEYIELKK